MSDHDLRFSGGKVLLPGRGPSDGDIARRHRGAVAPASAGVSQ